MSAPPRHHRPRGWTFTHGQDIRAAVRTLTQFLDDANHHRERHDGRWQRPQPSGWMPRNTPRWYGSQRPHRMFQRTPLPRQQGPFVHGELRRGDKPTRFPPRSTPKNWRSRVLPRTGPPVAAIKVPRWHGQEDPSGRRPRGNGPRGPVQGGPERSANDLHREPQGRLWGGPKGQPRNHRCQAGSQQRATPTEARWPEVRQEHREDQPSSRWMEGVEKEDGDRSREPMPGERAGVGMTWTGR